MVKYKNYLQTRMAGQETYIQSFVEDSKEVAEQYIKLDK